MYVCMRHHVGPREALTHMTSHTHLERPSQLAHELERLRGRFDPGRPLNEEFWHPHVFVLIDVYVGPHACDAGHEWFRLYLQIEDDRAEFAHLMFSPCRPRDLELAMVWCAPRAGDLFS